MSLRATLGADFAQFSQALTTVELKLKESGDIAKNVGRDLSKMVEGFRGTDLLRQAELAAQGIDRIGGVSKLTEREQARVNATITEAIAKYRALGQEVPPHLQKIASETSKVGTAAQGMGSSLGSMSSMLGKLGPALGVTFSVGAVVSFGKELLRTGDAVQKMADQVGESTENIQRMQYISGQTGVSLEGMVGAVQNLQQRLGSNDSGAVGALRQLGIAQADFQRLNPYDQFVTLSAAIGGVEDPTRRAAIASEVFGKSWKEMMPAIIADVKRLGDEAPVMADRTIAALDRTGDAIDRLKMQATSMAGEVTIAIADTFGNFGSFIGKAMRDGIPMAIAQVNAEALGRDLAAKLKPMSVRLHDVFELDARAAKPLEDVLGLLGTQTIPTLTKSVQAAVPPSKTLAEILDDMGMSAGAAAPKIGMLGGQLIGLGEATKKALPFLGWEGQNANGTLFSKPFDVLMAKLPAVSGGMAAVGATVQSSFTAKIGKATDVVDQLSRVAEMSGHKTTAALLSTASATAKAFASGGPWAAAIAFASGMLTTFADKLFKIEGKKVNDLRDAFVSAAGGIDALNRQAVAAGTTLDALLRAKTVKDYEAAVAALNTKLEKTAALQGELATLQQTLADRSVMNWRTAEEAAARYGITLDSLGPKFTGAKLHDGFLALWNDWQTLIDMGADVGAVLAGMSDEISGFVQQSMALGTEVPEQFRPLIEELIRTGQLLDANGNAITDMSAIKFGAPLVSEVDKIVTAIDKLVAALTDHLIPTIGTIPRQIRIKVGYDYDPYAPAGGGGVQDPNADHGGTAQFAGGTHGQYVDFGAGTPVVLHGRERVVTETEGRSGGGGGTVILQINGRTLAELIVPALPGVIREYALG